MLIQSIMNESAKDEKNLGNQFSSEQAMTSFYLHEWGGENPDRFPQIPDYTDAGRLVKAANRKSPTRQTIPLPDVNGHNGEPPSEHAFFSVFPAEDGEVTKGMEPTGLWSAQDKGALDLVNEVMHHLHGTSDARPKVGSLEGDTLSKARLDGAFARPNSWLASDYNDAQFKSLRARQHWAVDYHSAGEIVKLGLVETYIMQQFGKEARRIWKALDERGKMEEKQVCHFICMLIVPKKAQVAGTSFTIDRQNRHASCQGRS